MKPLSDLHGSRDQRALQMARFRSHLKQVMALKASMEVDAAELNRLDQQRKELTQKMYSANEDCLFFLMEVKDQIGKLLVEGFTAAEIEEICGPEVASVIDEVDVNVLLPKRMHDESP